MFRHKSSLPDPKIVRRMTLAKQLWEPRRDATYTPIASTDLCKGDHVLVEAGDTIPGDGEVIDGVASVNEAAVTGAEAPVIHESGGGRSWVTSGSQVLSGWLVVRITTNPASETAGLAAE